MAKHCNVVVLPTKKRSNIQMCSNDTLFWHDKPIISTKIGNGELYITSDEEIKEDDWCYNSKRKSIESGKYMIGSNEFIFCKKIIATTDTSLGLPQPPQQFIQKYIEEYNKGRQIIDIIVEYEEY